MTDSVPVVEPGPETRLAALLGQYEGLKARAEEAAAQFDACKNSIKALVAGEHPESSRVVVRSGSLEAPLELVAVETMRLDTKKFKAERPLDYCSYTYKSTSWQLRRLK